MSKKEIVKIGRYVEFEHEDGIFENMLLLTEKEANALEKQLKELYKKEEQTDQLTNNWNELEEWLLNHYEVKNKIQNKCIDEVLDKMKEIKENNNEKNRFNLQW